MLNACMFFNSSDFANDIILKVKDDLLIPSLVTVVTTFFLACVILVALVSSQCFRSSNAMLYFNITMADAIMAFFGIFALALPHTMSFHKYRNAALVLFILRCVSFEKFVIYWLKV